MKQLLKILLPALKKKTIAKYFFIGMVSGLTNFFFINAVTWVIQKIISGEYTTVKKEYILLFLAIILIYIWTRRTLSLFIIRTSMAITWKFRIQILSLVINANYEQLFNQKPRIQAAILSDVNTLTNAAIGVIGFVISFIMAISCMIYLASVSFMLFCITLLISLAGVGIYFFTSKSSLKNLEKSRNLEDVFQANLNSILNGIKEINISPEKGRFLFEKRLLPNANESFHFDTTAITGFLNNQLLGQILFFMLITSILLILSILLNISSASVVGFVFTLIYFLSSVEGIMSQLPTIIRAGVSANQLTELQSDLSNYRFDNTMQPDSNISFDFADIKITNLSYSYVNEQNQFTIGPLDFKVSRGETIFIYGANGSGKTTFVNTLIGLCFPKKGIIELDGKVIDAGNYLSYKRLFSVVFSDFFLFDQFMGENEPDISKWIIYLQLFELAEKVSLKNRTFSAINLSQGERKRLALISALLEEKPILILDEWAADQDPYFRKKFYTQIIPFLNKSGFTIVAITHDDKYYHHADRLFKMEDGNLLEEKILLQTK